MTAKTLPNLDLSQPVRQRCGLSVRNVELRYGESNQEKCFPIYYECQKKNGEWGEPRISCRLTGEASIYNQNLCDWDLVNHPDGVLILTDATPTPPRESGADITGLLTVLLNCDNAGQRADYFHEIVRIFEGIESTIATQSQEMERVRGVIDVDKIRKAYFYLEGLGGHEQDIADECLLPILEALTRPAPPKEPPNAA